jgi:sigma-B regulation protein RsbU (phosphoserine phosphatase)
MLLSCFEDTEYDEEEMFFEKGSTLVVFTDGITEAMNESNEEFSEERLYNLIEKKVALPSQQLSMEILSDVKNYSAGVPQFDDITLMIIKRSE